MSATDRIALPLRRPATALAAWQRSALVLAGLAAALAPLWLLESFHLFQLTMAVIMALAVLGLNIVTGYNGQISLGHGAFFAVGAYATAILMSHLDWSFWATLPVSAVVCGLIGYGVGFPALRLGGLYLALTTFSLAVAVPQILKHKSIEGWTGGVQGLFLVKPDPPAFLPLTPDQWMYCMALIVSSVCFLLAWNLIRGRIGRALMATRDHPIAAEAMGMDIAALKTQAFAVSAMITGLAGSLSAVAVEYVAPDSFSFALSINLFVGMVVGGVASILGSLFGGLFVLFVPNIAEAISKAAPGVIYGVILIAFLFLLPDGFAGLLRRLAARLRRASP
ncbi:branched-chain amino acid ABC transporter permease [Siccirubricoccus sp. KC 17139]|uniref:Branched-chain amino acid ABC transporter permease n=1 Tax=Siccirubricoccus soli TaxID=2899147 RepID=A0ABT1D3N6_9PROT|nr:branched-chain amino acid ABC transporter permease [Siccirubricoccus soli]MCO6416494.1 branched-chain amino acid ABC transporter permease [Siccirubricoccus soli]MCP2682628.1 branched-chain amino acid ABC transporter permease [Siccirubricoccus soli]